MITLNQSIWQLIDNVQAAPNLTLGKVEGLLGQTLKEDLQKSNNFFKFYFGEPVQLAGNTQITHIDLRIPLQGAQSMGLFSVKLSGQCISLPQVKQVHPKLEITGAPRGRSPEEATTYSAGNTWGQIDFGFQEKNPDCLAYVVLKPAK